MPFLEFERNSVRRKIGEIRSPFSSEIEPQKPSPDYSSSPLKAGRQEEQLTFSNNQKPEEISVKSEERKRGRRVIWSSPKGKILEELEKSIAWGYQQGLLSSQEVEELRAVAPYMAENRRLILDLVVCNGLDYVLSVTINAVIISQIAIAGNGNLLPALIAFSPPGIGIYSR